MAQDGDVVMTMGAGSISSVPAQLQQMSAAEKQ
jgi:UDP-N-acetylmuramate-alanine ligase